MNMQTSPPISLFLRYMWRACTGVYSPVMLLAIPLLHRACECSAVVLHPRRTHHVLCLRLCPLHAMTIMSLMRLRPSLLYMSTCPPSYLLSLSHSFPCVSLGFGTMLPNGSHCLVSLHLSLELSSLSHPFDCLRLILFLCVCVCLCVGILYALLILSITRRSVAPLAPHTTIMYAFLASSVSPFY